MSAKRRNILITGSLCLVLLAAAPLVMRYYLVRGIRVWIAQKYNGYYTFDAGIPVLDPFGGKIILYNLTLKADPTVPVPANAPGYTNLKCHKLILRNIHWKSLISGEMPLAENLELRRVTGDFKRNRNQQKTNEKKNPAVQNILISEAEVRFLSETDTTQASWKRMTFDNMGRSLAGNQLFIQLKTGGNTLKVTCETLKLNNIPDADSLRNGLAGEAEVEADGLDILLVRSANTLSGLNSAPPGLSLPTLKISNLSFKDQGHLMFTDTLIYRKEYLKILGFAYSEDHPVQKDRSLFHLPRIEAWGFDPAGVLLNREGKMDSLRIADTDLTWKLMNPIGSKKSENGRYVLPAGIEIRKLILNNLTMNVESAHGDWGAEVQNMYIYTDTIKLIKDQAFRLPDLKLNSGKMHFRMPGGLYTIEFNTSQLDTKTGDMEFREFRLIPNWSESLFGQKAGYQTDRMTLEIPLLRCRGFSLNRWVDENVLSAAEIQADSFGLDIYRDRRVAVNPNRRVLMPQQLLKKLSFGISVDKIEAADGTLRYREFSAKRNKEAGISFGRTAISVTNVSNRTTSDLTMIWNLSAYLENQAKLEVSAEIPLNADDCHHTVDGKLAPMPFSVLNQFLAPATGINITEGHMDGLTFKIVADSQKADLNMTLLYNDLKITVNKNEVEGQEIKVNKFLSGLANMFILNNNPGLNGKVRTAELSYIRNKSRFVISFWWKTLLNGMLKSFLPDMAKKMEDSRQKMQERDKKRKARQEKRELKRQAKMQSAELSKNRDAEN